jgi:SSS family solute:Na+ symporter
MFWKRTSPWGGFAGLVAGTGLALTIFALEQAGVIQFGAPMAGNFWRAIWAFGTCFVVTIAVSMVTRPKPEQQLEGLVYSLTPKRRSEEPHWWKKPAVLAGTALTLMVALNIVFF